jgi:tetratricopeptide (TPR) repeat protein
MAKRSKKSPAKKSTPKVAVSYVSELPPRQILVGLALILLTTFLIYSPALHGGMVWDDDVNLTRPELQSLNGLYRIWFDPANTARDMQYYPLVHTAFWIEHKFWGDTYLGYHLVNVVWHSVAVVLVYLIVDKLKIPGALLAAAVFAFHPVMVESVAWMTEQKNTLSTVFYLGAMLSYLKFDDSRRRSRYFVALGLFALALLCKTAWVTLPFALLVIAWWQRGRLTWQRDVSPLLPFFALSVAAGLMTMWVEWKLVGAEGTEFELTFLQRVLLAGRDIWFYLGKLLWPTKLSFTYFRWTIDPAQGWQWIFPIAALVTTFALVAIRKRWRGPLAGWLLFCGTLAPVLGFLNVYMFKYTYVADHLQYLPSLGMIVLLSAGIAFGLARSSLAVRRSGFALCLLMLGTLAIMSFRQSRIYADVVTLYRATLELNPESWPTHNNLGTILSAKGESEEAIEHYQTALRIKPDYYQAQTNLGTALANRGQLQEAFDHLHKAVELRPTSVDVHRNLGNALLKTNRLPEAVGEFRAALALRSEDPLTLNSLGSALTQMSLFDEAIEHLQHAVRLVPNYSEAHGNLGNALAKSGRLAEGVNELRVALALKPDDPGTINNLGVAYLSAGRLPEAIEQLERAVRVNTSAEAHSNLGNALTKAGRLPEAIAQLQSAVALKPDYVSALNNLGIALMQAGRVPEAIEHLQHAIRLQPDFADAHNNLGAALTHTGKFSDAIEQFRQTERLNPNDFNAHNNLGVLLAQTGAFDESLTQFEQAMRLRPDSADVHNSIGDLSRESGKLPQAIEHYQAALRLAPNSVQVYANLAQALSASNRAGEAIATAKQGIVVANSAGQHAIARQLEQWLSELQTGPPPNRDIASPRTSAPPSGNN